MNSVLLHPRGARDSQGKDPEWWQSMVEPELADTNAALN